GVLRMVWRQRCGLDRARQIEIWTRHQTDECGQDPRVLRQRSRSSAGGREDPARSGDDQGHQHALDPRRLCVPDAVAGVLGAVLRRRSQPGEERGSGHQGSGSRHVGRSPPLRGPAALRTAPVRRGQPARRQGALRSRSEGQPQ
ncbi:MAG: hypothetical protein WC483_06305, partial [Candidatus Paceibacterota bacterium]